MHLTKAAAKSLGLDNNHGAKVKADKAHGRSLIDGVILQVKLLTVIEDEPGIEGEPEYQFALPERQWRFDAAWVEHKVALELNGWTSHHRRARMAEDNVKLAAAVRMGWRVFFATVPQAKREAALWVAALIEAGANAPIR